jgi:hypothetical protein
VHAGRPGPSTTRPGYTHESDTIRGASPSGVGWAQACRPLTRLSRPYPERPSVTPALVMPWCLLQGAAWRACENPSAVSFIPTRLGYLDESQRFDK